MSVTTAWESFNDYMHGGEPVIRQWFLLQDFKQVFLISSVYVLFVKYAGPAWMKNKKAFDLKNIMLAYNAFLVAFYIYFLARGIFYLPYFGWQLFCGPMRIGANPLIGNLYSLGWQLYMIKYLELLDTVFLVLRKKFNMITTLHVFHHAIVPVFGFMGLRSETSPYHSVFIGINSCVHVLMYAYYGIALLGPQFHKYLWWKRYLTLLQILQFVFITAYMALMQYLGCATSMTTFYITCGLCVLFCILFINYYIRTFLLKGKPADIRNGYTKHDSLTQLFMNGKSKLEEKMR